MIHTAVVRLRVALAFALLIIFAVPLHATLIVSFLSGQIGLFDDAGKPLGTINGGAEGVACVTGGVPALFIADNTPTIHVYDPTTLTSIGSVAISGGSKVAALALSPDGSVLYAADYGANKIFALSTAGILTAIGNSTPTVTPTASVSTTASHDVAVDTNGNVYASHFQNATGVEKYSPTLTLLPAFLTPTQASNIGLRAPSGILVALGSVWVSNFRGNDCTTNPTDCPSVYQFDLAGNLLHKINAPAGSTPIGLALGPGDGNIYVALLSTNAIGKIDVANGSFTMSTFIANAGTQPKYLQFTENCTTANNAVIEVCKTSSITDPVSGNFNFTLTNGTFNVQVTIPPGVCSGPISVPAGTVKVTEGAVAGTGVSSITAYGYNAGTSVVENRLVSSDLANRFANVTVPAGNIANETIVEFTNFKVPTGIVEICKEATPGVTGSFSFNVAGAANNPYTIPAGACSGPIAVQAGAVTIAELPRAGFSLADVSTIPSDRLVSINVPAGSAVVTVPAGNVTAETVVKFANAPATTGQLKICKVAGPGVVVGQTFTITVNGTSYTVPAGPASLGGTCVVDGTFPVGSTVTVQETPPAPFQVLNMTVNPPDRGNTPVLANGNGQVSVTIGGGFTEVTVTNIGSTPTGQLKLCKIAGTAGVGVGANFSFSVANGGTTQMYTVPAGPSQQGGYCIADGTFPLGTKLTVAELPAPGFVVSGISVNGTPLPAGSPSASITVGNGITEVAFTNSAGRTGGTSQPFLSVVNYQVVSRTDNATTYRADLLNVGPGLASVTATVTSLDSSVAVVAGANVLAFAAVPANSETTSSDTFTIVSDPARPLDLSKLRWTLEARPLRRRAAGR